MENIYTTWKENTRDPKWVIALDSLSTGLKVDDETVAEDLCFLLNKTRRGRLNPQKLNKQDLIQDWMKFKRDTGMSRYCPAAFEEWVMEKLADLYEEF